MAAEQRKLEDYYANRPIPLNKRKHWLHVAAIYFGLTASLSSFTTAGSYITGLSLSQAIVSNITSYCVLALVFFLPMGIIGAREGLNTYNIGEGAFGALGSKLTTALVVTIIPSIGWYGIQVSIAADALSLGLGSPEALTPWIMIFLGILFAIPAMYGITSMAWLDFISIPIILFIVGFGLYKAIHIGGGMDGLFAYEPETAKSILWGINLSVGGMIIGTTFLPDYARWTHKKPSGIALSGFVGLSPELLLVIVGVIMALTASTLGVDQPWNVAEVLHALGLPVVALFLVIILQWTTNITAAYSSGLALEKIFGWSRFWWTFISAVLGTALAMFGIIDHFINFIMLLSIFVSPVAGVIMSDYFLVAKGKLIRKDLIYWPGIVSWIFGSVFAYFFPYFIEAINGLIAGGVFYWLYHVITSKKKGEA
ncbi:cytosine permease [Bacillus thermophilus]|uniref:Cytosine permease n=1 Tax=Siminovitchia thermophila TaxID=1245522 RepID=A0ABS2R5Q2_9BACI|nr:cytosine permease [Siminovitchia thermophila]MBM7714982.1 cytosine permease [Siminovitchia thermophila]ONK21011.1 hypothetical protein BLX87_24085 [Bacillus sp. VT-16-64]